MNTTSRGSKPTRSPLFAPLASAAVAFSLTACQPITDLQERLFGGESSEDQTGQNETPSPAAEQTAQMVAALPAGADVILRFDVVSARRGMEPLAVQAIGAPPTDEQIDTVARTALIQLGMPADVAGRIRASQAQSMMLVVYGEQESIILVTQPSILNNAPADGANESMEELTIARRGDQLFVGMGAPMDSLVSGTPAPEGTLDPAAQWAAGWSAGDGAIFQLFIPDFAAVPDDLLREMDIEAAGDMFTRLNLVVDRNGRADALLGMTDDAPLRRVLGAAQAAASQGLTEMRGELPPQAQGFGNYLDLVLRAAWAQLIYEFNDGTVHLGVHESACGQTWMHSLALVGVIAAGSEEVERFPNATFTPQTQRVADNCMPMPGPAAAYPRQLARVVGFEDGQSSAAGAVMMDLGGLAREILPTFVGLLPFALHPDDIASALAPTQLGLPSYDAAGQYIVAAGTDTGGMPAFFVAIPEAMRAVVPPEAMIFPGVSQPEVGYVIAMPDGTAALARTYNDDAGWARALAALPENSAIAAVANGAAIQQAIEGMRLRAQPETTPIADALSRAQYVAMSVDLVAGSRLVFYVPEDAAGAAEQFNTGVRGLVDRMIAQADDEMAGIIDPMASAAMARFQARVENGNLVVFNLAPASSDGSISSAALTAMVGVLPNFIMGMRGPSMDELPEEIVQIANSQGAAAVGQQLAEAAVRYFDTPRLSESGKVEPGRFPPSFGPLPSEAQIAAACSTGAPLIVDAAAWSAGPGSWFQPMPPSAPLGLQIESRGAGSSATFTITAFEDIDCDGTTARHVFTGFVQNGDAIWQARPPINPGE